MPLKQLVDRLHYDFFCQAATTNGFLNGKTQGKAANAADRFRKDEHCDRLDGSCDNFGIREPEISVGLVHQNPQIRINFAALHSYRTRVQHLCRYTSASIRLVVSGTAVTPATKIGLRTAKRQAERRLVAICYECR